MNKDQIILENSKYDQMYDWRISYETKDQTKVNEFCRLPNKLNMLVN